MTDSPFVVSTYELRRSPGAMIEVEATASSETDLGNQVISVPAQSPIALDLRLESVMDGVLVTGFARAEARGECVRCLRPVTADLAVDITELFAYMGARHVKTEDDADEEAVPQVHADTVDLEGTVIDALVTSLPLRPLCDPGCPGLCPECGIRMEDAEPGHAHEKIDPRWAALAALAGPQQEGELDSDADDEGAADRSPGGGSSEDAHEPDGGDAPRD
ncbi:YceD family protein [Pseudactinotalea sp. Z1748]|uniref:YceD family protein n=1 Tax=Pseudactinotalea sp. Z1748 TaxID=3413027 RepID=UPI003C7C2719